MERATTQKKIEMFSKIILGVGIFEIIMKNFYLFIDIWQMD